MGSTPPRLPALMTPLGVGCTTAREPVEIHSRAQGAMSRKAWTLLREVTMSSGLGRLLPMTVVMGAMTTGCWLADFGYVDVDPGYYPEPDPGVCGASSPGLVPSGRLQTSLVPIDYSGGKVAVSSVHKVDVDAIEDGCMSQLELTVSLAQGQCPLKLVFTRSNGSYGGLVEARLTADSACPGFLDAVEGLYSSPAVGFAPWRYVGPQVVSERMASAVCLRTVRFAFPDAPLRLYRSSPSAAELTVNLSGLVIEGELPSKGNPEAKCFDASSCGPGLHNGGDGWCVYDDKCSPGYRLSLDGTCVP